MRKIIPLLVLVLFSAVFVKAQNVSQADANLALQLVSSNKAAIGISDDLLSNAKVFYTYEDNMTGIRYVSLQQQYKGIPVYNQILALSFRNGRLLSNFGKFDPSIEKTVNVSSATPAVTAESAVQSALSDRGFHATRMAVALSRKDQGRFVEFSNMGVSRENITARLTWVPNESARTYSIAWQVYIIPKTTSDYWMVRVNAIDNSILGMDNYTDYDNWGIPNENPNIKYPAFDYGKAVFVTDDNSNDQPKNIFDFKTVEDPSLVTTASYRVVPIPAESPLHPGGAPALRTDPWTNAGVVANAVTLKWHTGAAAADYDYSRSNNVWAYEDRTAPANTGSVAKSATSLTAFPNLSFDFVPDFTQEPTVNTVAVPNQRFNITNLFYWNNLIHDIFYGYGFTEAGKNFQDDNLGRGGAGNDHVNAEAQDASGTNNANFSTPADGSSGRMQMYLWTAPTPDRDGDVDNGIIIHEYGHGISNRSNPGGTGCLGNSEQAGEGWSDYLGLMLTQNWATSVPGDGFNSPRGIGTYALNQPNNGPGIRPARYCTDFAVNNYTYSNIGAMAVPHGVGFVFCTALWEMTWELINDPSTTGIDPNIYNFAGTGGNVVALRLVMEGLRTQQCNPGFISARNAIMRADTTLYGATHACAILRAFARRGMGLGAAEGSTSSITDQTVSFNGGGPAMAFTQNGQAGVPELQNIVYNHAITANCSAITNYTLRDTIPTNANFVSATNGGTYNAGNRVVSWPVNIAVGATQNYGLTLQVAAGSYFPPVSIINEPVPSTTISGFWATSSTTANVWIAHNVRSKSVPNSFFTPDAAIASDQIIATTASFAIGATPPVLSFWHWYNSEASWDGGVLEISTNGGTTWSDIGSANFTQNGYNGALNTGSANPLTGRQAWNGNSGAFVETKVNMTPYANQANVKLRWRFGSDGSLGATGWNVDDILMETRAVVNLRSSLFNATNVRVTFSDTVTVILPATTANPNVTINQAAAQADPTAASPINFTVVFTEPVVGFATGDVTLSGTAGATTATVTGGPTTFNVAVSGMTTCGTVIATIAAGVCTNAALDPNNASTSTDNTVTYNNGTAPTVTINQAAAQTDPTTALPVNFTVVFNQPVTGFATGDVTISGTAPGAPVATVTGGPTTYNVAVTGLTGSGTVIASIAAGVCQSLCTQNNVASTSTDNTVTYNSVICNTSVNPVANQTYCNGATTAAINFSSPAPGTTFSWTNNTTSIGLGASGNGNIPSFVATNATAAPVTATITVTPTLTVVTPTVTTFNFTGAAQTFTVPAGVTSINFTALGAQGGSGATGTNNGGTVAGGAGGLGSRATGTLAVTPGQVLNIFVGGAGGTPTAGFNGGGAGGSANAGGGGGSSDVRFPGATTADRILTAAGGGGGGRGGCEGIIGAPGAGGAGGNGDGNGSNGANSVTAGGVAGGGFGAIGTSFGGAGIGCAGFLGAPGLAGTGAVGGNGGAGQTCCCFSFGSIPGGGGGGGGQLGGGGGGGGSAGTTGCSGNDKGAGGGGAGGTSFTGGVTAGVVTTNIQSGDGQVVLNYNVTNICNGPSITFTITVNPTPAVNAIPNQVVCQNAPTAPVNFTGTPAGVVFQWTNNTPAIGLAAAGTGNIPSFIAQNPGTTPLVATITVTPVTGLAGPVTTTFAFTGAVQTYTVPAGVTSINIKTWGAQGNSSSAGGAGGLGGYAEGNLAVTPGQVLNVTVGGGGTSTLSGGFNGGGNAGTSACATAIGGGGGGASDVRIAPYALANRVIVGAGGGGAGGDRVANCGRGTGGGGGGGLYGGGGGSAWIGSTAGWTLATGGTQAAGGAGGTSTFATVPGNNGSAGVLAIGGAGGVEVNSAQAGTATGPVGGVGGGLTGTGGNHPGIGNFIGASGAGGSSYIGGVSGGLTTPGLRSGNGQVQITYTPTSAATCFGTARTFTITVNPNANLVIVADPGTTICEGDPTLLTVRDQTGVAGAPVPEILYYKFDGTGNTVPNLASAPPPGSATGTIVGNQTQGGTGQCGTALVGVGGAANANNMNTGWNTNFTGPFTISFWLGANQVDNNPSYLFGNSNATSVFRAFYGGAALANNLLLRGGSGDILITGVNPAATLVTVVYNGTNTAVYKNGAFFQNYAVTFNTSAAAPLLIGGYNSTSLSMTGRLDEFRLYNRALTAGEVAQLTNCASAGGGPISTGTFLWTPAAGLSSTTSNPVAASPQNTTTYTVTRTTVPGGCVASANITINVNKRPVVTTQPASIARCAGASASFTVGATGTGLTYQWQESAAGCAGPWINLSNGGAYSGATSPTLTVNPVTGLMNGYAYRCVVSGVCAPWTPPTNVSGCAVLTVNPLPVVTITPVGPVCGGVAGINGTQLSTASAPPPVPGSVSVSSGTINLAVPDNTANGVSNVIAMAGVPANATITNVSVTFNNFSHTYPGDMIIHLRAPNGAILNLYKYGTGLFTGPASGVPAWGWYGAKVSQTGTTAWSTVAAAPFIYNNSTAWKADAINTPVGGGPVIQNPTGFVSAANSFADLYTTPASTTGNWTLAMCDGGPGDVGTLGSWNLTIDYTTPGTTNSTLTYVWSPITGLYNDPQATIPYTGTNTPVVYAAPTVQTTYTVTATNTVTGCVSTTSVLVNYTPPAPTVTPSSVTMCLGDPAVKLKATSSQSFSNTFSSGTVNVTIPDGPAIPPVPTTYPATTSNITVSGIPAGATITGVRARFNVTHAYVGDLVMALKAPNGSIFNLDAILNRTNNPGANFTNTVIGSAGTTLLSAGTAPFTGTFKADAAGATFTAFGFTFPGGPVGYVPNVTSYDALYNTGSVNGVWSIGIYDVGAPDGGTLNNWSLDIDYTVGVVASAALWSPAAGLFSDPLALNPYVAGTRVDSVWARPTPSGVYPYQVTVNNLISTGSVIPLPPQASTFTGNVRGYWFTAPSSFTMSSVEVPTTASSGTQNIAVLRFNGATPPPAFPGTTNAFTTLFLTQNNPATGPIPVNIQINAGDVIGILGNRANVNSYSANPPNTTVINGTPVNLTRMGMQFPLATTAPQQIWQEAAFQISRVQFSTAQTTVGTCQSPARTVVVTVNQPTTLNAALPADQTVCTDKVATFTAAVTAGSGPHSYQWQVSSDAGNTFTNISNGGVYSGATTATLTITAPPVSMSGYQYRVSVTGAAPCASVISRRATLTVNPLPVIAITPVYSALFPGMTTTLTSTVTPNAASTYTWLRDGVQLTAGSLGVLSGIGTGTLRVDVDGMGLYSLRVTDVNGCTNTSNSAVVKDSASGRCFIYPNPTSGRFQVRYYSVAGNNNLPRGIVVYDAKGDRVFIQNYTIGRPYDRMDVDMRAYGKGLYWVEVVDRNGNRLTMCRVVIQ